jgi:hypothetical protein
MKLQQNSLREVMPIAIAGLLRRLSDAAAAGPSEPDPLSDRQALAPESRRSC